MPKRKDSLKDRLKDNKPNDDKVKDNKINEDEDMPNKEKFEEIMESGHFLRRACCNIFIFARKVNIKCSDNNNDDKDTPIY